MLDNITVLETLGPLLTKTFCSDGSVIPYGDAASFKVKTVAVAGWDDLRKLLASLHNKPKRCLIRGKLTGTDSNKPGTFVRTNANFSDQPLHWFMVDVDGFEPGFAMPTDPAAVEEYIEEVLPAFKGASYYWHMSSSAGQSSKLKCHIHFLSKTPYTSAQMKAWAKTVGKQVDSALFSRVQAHYTADPIYEEGRTDPVSVRAGFHQGEQDFVDLVITGEAHEAGAGEGGSDMKLVDPSEKDGIIGLFHRTYSAEEVLLTLLDEFDQVSDRRYTWLNGGGTPEGVWVHDDGLHVGSSHNTWPINGIANLWDLVRVFKFGQLDQAEDDFEQLDIDSRGVGHRPSDVAMREWAAKLPELQVTQREERSAELNRWRNEITNAPDLYTLENVIVPGIRGALLSPGEQAVLAAAYNTRLGQVATKMEISQVRKLLRPVREVSRELPDWAVPYVWVVDDNAFFNVNTKQLVSERSFNAKFDRRIIPDQDGNRPRASDMVLKEWGMAVVDMRLYHPANEKDLFYLDDDPTYYANTYRHDSAKAMPDHFSVQDRKAIQIVEEHAALLIPNDVERGLFLDYLAYCVQRPGMKIRWAPVLKGVEGDGKSAFATMIGHILGVKNVRILDSSTLEGSDFTSWRTGQCFTAIEEIKLHGHNRYDVFNKLKTPLSNDVVEIHCKGKDPITVPNTTNYLLLTNFDDGLPINDNDRRIMFLRSPFLRKEDLLAKLQEKGYATYQEYYDTLFDFAIKKHAGALRKWLIERELSPDFNPDGRAPDTTARDMIVDMSRRDDEDAIDTILAEGGLGIYPDLVTVTHLTSALLNRYGQKLQTSRVKAVLASYGFVMWGSHQVRWAGQQVRFYYRGPRPVNPALLADTLEAERNAKELEDGFAD